MYAALEYLKKETINEVVCNKLDITHVTDSYARAAGKRFCIEASVREIERVSRCASTSTHGKAWLATRRAAVLAPTLVPMQIKPLGPKR
jgi:hypothetical protein